MDYKECMAVAQRPTALAIHGSSHAIKKLKPKIKIVHVFAPEIIQTDAANFRELVQRLTGKPTVRNIDSNNNKGKNKKKEVCMASEEGVIVPRCKQQDEVVGLWSGEQEFVFGEGVKIELEEEERELWVEKTTSGDLWGELGEGDGFLQDLSFDDLPFLLPSGSSQLDNLQPLQPRMWIKVLMSVATKLSHAEDNIVNGTEGMVEINDVLEHVKEAIPMGFNPDGGIRTYERG